MPGDISSASEHRRRANLAILGGIAAIVAILGLAAWYLMATLPDANSFNDRVAHLFAESDGLTSPAEIRLLEVLARSGTIFAETLASYRMVILVLLVFAAALLVTALALLVMLTVTNRRLSEMERAGIEVRSLVISRGDGIVYLNNLEFQLTDAALETLAALAEARLDGEVLSGAQLEALISGREPADCDETAGATRIKRLRDTLGNQLVRALLVKTVPRRGYMLSIDPAAIRIL